MGFAQGYRGAKPEQIEPYKHGPEEIAQINENITNTWPTTPNAPTNPSQNITQISRSEAFNFGSDSDLGFGSRNPVGSFSTYPRPPKSKPYTGGDFVRMIKHSPEEIALINRNLENWQMIYETVYEGARWIAP